MKEKSHKIFWNGDLVGEMIEPNFDMFFSYGKWKSANLPATEKFLNKLRNEEQLVVKINNVETGIAGVIELFPNEEIEVKHYPNLD